MVCTAVKIPRSRASEIASESETATFMSLYSSSAGAASFRRHSTLQECRCEAEKAVHDLRTQLDTDPGAASRKQAAARRRAAEDRERRVRAALAVTEELHAKQQEAARKEAERAARKAPQDAAADAKGEAGEPASKKGKKGSAARSSRPPGRPQSAAERAGLKPGDLVTELDGTPVRDAADLQLRLALLRTCLASPSRSSFEARPIISRR